MDDIPPSPPPKPLPNSMPISPAPTRPPSRPRPKPPDMKPPDFMPVDPALFCAIPGDGDVIERSIGAAERGAVAVGGGALQVRAPRLPKEPPNPGLAKPSAE